MTRRCSKLPNEAASALKAARRLLIAERKSQFECFTIAPRRSYEQMNAAEREAIIRFDRVIEKINVALG
ncbi:MAG TPA: hypothetical protein VMU08_00135 [Rhizomicrobium sp.]|nr:hypothetical protein [Rhizomicrobium sp.]